MSRLCSQICKIYSHTSRRGPSFGWVGFFRNAPQSPGALVSTSLALSQCVGLLHADSLRFSFGAWSALSLRQLREKGFGYKTGNDRVLTQ